MYRPEIKVVDCTIRDGGLTNDSHFTLETVRAAYRAACDAGIDYVELGYRNSKELFPTKDFGAWKYCDDEKIREVIDGIESNLKISIMVDAHRVKEQTFAPAHESPVDLIRVATYVKDIDKAIDLIRQEGRASTTLLQRRLRIGYARAARIIEALEEQGVIGPDMGGSRGREVLIAEDA